jgi:hypothetical protein
MKKQEIFDIQLSKVGKMGAPIDEAAKKPKVKQYRETKRTSRS